MEIKIPVTSGSDCGWLHVEMVPLNDEQRKNNFHSKLDISS